MLKEVFSLLLKSKNTIKHNEESVSLNTHHFSYIEPFQVWVWCMSVALEPVNCWSLRCGKMKWFQSLAKSLFSLSVLTKLKEWLAKKFLLSIFLSLLTWLKGFSRYPRFLPHQNHLVSAVECLHLNKLYSSMVIHE